MSDKFDPVLPWPWDSFPQDLSTWEVCRNQYAALLNNSNQHYAVTEKVNMTLSEWWSKIGTNIGKLETDSNESYLRLVTMVAWESALYEMPYVNISFDDWWHEIGSKIEKQETESAEVYIYRVVQEAWKDVQSKASTVSMTRLDDYCGFEPDIFKS